ncbi:MAG: GNAT family N-acetyltransferase [Anaerolineae bacterium]|nr:GNAT family N-acetyltransferase [Anaerolineae bacterium]
MAEVTYRPGTNDDSFTVFEIFVRTILDLSRRMGVETISGGQDESALQKLWARRRPLFEHLARTGEHFWLAEKEGQPIGYARSILRDGLRELTEFFVLPDQQSAGVGRELLNRVFPAEGARHRSLVATPDTPAMVRYLKANVYPHGIVNYFSRKPRQVEVATDLAFEPMSASPDTLDHLWAVDQVLLGHRRDVDHIWLLDTRQGYLYRRAGQVAGYGYVGDYSGPFAVLDDTDFPAVLAHAERQASDITDEFGLEVPLENRAVVDYLLAQGFRMEDFITLFMSDARIGKFENYILTSPPFFV